MLCRKCFLFILHDIRATIFCFYQLKTIMSKMLLYPLVYILHMSNKMYYKTFSILSLLFGRKSPTELNLLLLFATDSS